MTAAADRVAAAAARLAGQAVAQGHPVTVEDREVLRSVAAVIRHSRRGGGVA